MFDAHEMGANEMREQNGGFEPITTTATVGATILGGFLIMLAPAGLAAIGYTIYKLVKTEEK